MKQIIYIVAFIVLIVIAFRFMRKIEDVPEEPEYPLTGDLAEEDEITEEEVLNEENKI
ncbi:hypothetical protein FACS189421_06530 [Bacteroidia bacterium]|nr:hypothetical protein FACS189421_06530 [Bacteroidia bacterium]GHT05129.1 hypothetical protein FACS189423_08850 [Bacteroidia bacterium]